MMTDKSKTYWRPRFRISELDFHIYRVGDWGDLKIELHISLHVGFKMWFAGIVPVFSEFNGFGFEKIHNHGKSAQTKY